jgi:hypothetical protein
MKNPSDLILEKPDIEKTPTNITKSGYSYTPLNGVNLHGKLIHTKFKIIKLYFLIKYSFYGKP